MNCVYCHLGLVSQSLYYLDETFLYTDSLNVESSDQIGVMVYVTLLVSMDLMDPFFLLFHHSKFAYQFA